MARDSLITVTLSGPPMRPVVAVTVRGHATRTLDTAGATEEFIAAALANGLEQRYRDRGALGKAATPAQVDTAIGELMDWHRAGWVWNMKAGAGIPLLAQAMARVDGGAPADYVPAVRALSAQERHTLETAAASPYAEACAAIRAETGFTVTPEAAGAALARAMADLRAKLTATAAVGE